MIQDYSSRCFLDTGTRFHRPKLMFTKKNTRQTSTGWMLWKSVGALLVLALIIGMASTYWFGSQIRVALDNVGKNQTIHKELLAHNNQLLARRDTLLSSESFESIAKELGLYPRSEGQVRHP